jgi:fumarate reductase flavoprotein subunit
MADDFLDSELIVVGAGIAGLVTAVRACEQGVRVIVLERGSEPRYLCNSRYTGGVFHVAFTDVYLPSEVLRSAVIEATDGFSDERLAVALAEGVKPALDWLKTLGTRFIRSGAYPWQSAVMAPPGLQSTGLHWQGRGGDVLLRLLGERLVSFGGHMRLGTAAIELSVTANGIDVAAMEGSERRKFAAKSVVLADGGFQGNADMVREHISPRPDRLRQRGAGTGMGDGIRMGEALGAKIVGMNRFYGHVQSRDAMTSDALWPYPVLDRLTNAGIIVDSSGRRFCDEGLGGVFVANAIAGLDDPLSSTVIFDQMIWDGPGRDFLLPANPNLATAGGTIFQAQTLGDLGDKAGLPVAALEQAIAGYNVAVRSGALDRLSPARSSRAGVAMPIATPPFYAVPACAGITYTMGGVATDDEGRALRQDGSAIPGLYAVGSTTGGLEGGPIAGYTGGLSKAITFALHAADNVASRHSHRGSG